MGCVSVGGHVNGRAQTEADKDRTDRQNTHRHTNRHTDPQRQTVTGKQTYRQTNLLCCKSFSTENSVAKQHDNSHRTNTARHWSDPRCHRLHCIELHVSHQPLARLLCLIYITTSLHELTILYSLITGWVVALTSVI